MANTETQTNHDVGNRNGYLCPECEKGDELRIAATVVGKLTPDGFDPRGDTEWDDNSYCQCDSCEWSGIVDELVTVKIDQGRRRTSPTKFTGDEEGLPPTSRQDADDSELDQKPDQ